ncbi:hypothetical protein ACJ7V3_12055 [Halomonas elongata]|uniref:hypothetical protein n=1 Tax=Halomonas elongata TaxID=2746 RepID=UPI0038D42B0E
MTNTTLKERLLSFRDAKKDGSIQRVKISGAGVATVEEKQLLKSRKVSNVVGKINRAKIDNFKTS